MRRHTLIQTSHEHNRLSIQSSRMVSNVASPLVGDEKRRCASNVASPLVSDEKRRCAAHKGRRYRGNRQLDERAARDRRLPATSHWERAWQRNVPRQRLGRLTIALLAPIMIAARCTEPDAAAPPVVTSRPTAPQPTTAPAIPTPVPKPQAAPAESPDAAPLADHTLELPTDGWLRVERLRGDVEGGWVSGHSHVANRIVIETHNVSQFSMDVSQLQLDWSRRVWVRINASSFELIHKRNPIIHLRATSTGAWELVKPHKE